MSRQEDATTTMMIRFTVNNRPLVDTLLQLESFMRRNFGLSHRPELCERKSRPLVVKSDNVHILLDDDKYGRLDAVRLVLINYMYDAYMRLLISERYDIVADLECVGTLTMLWSIARAYKLDNSLAEVTDDVQKFSDKLDNLRRLSNIDILMHESIVFLERQRTVFLSPSSLSLSPSPIIQPSLVHDQWNNSSFLPFLSSSGSLLDHMKTYYNVAHENQLFDHSSHYEDAFIPSYRFCDSRPSPVMNMSRHIGYTMRDNIRGLYRFIAEQIDDSSACPCVVIFNLFIRDNYRMYHSKSLRQSSCVSVVRSDGKCVKLSYMIITNNFPRVNSWFKSINNQLVKKTNKIHIQHLDTFVRMLAQLLSDQAKLTKTSTTAASSSSALSTSLTKGDDANSCVNNDANDDRSPLTSLSMIRKKRTIASAVTAGVSTKDGNGVIETMDQQRKWKERKEQKERKERKKQQEQQEQEQQEQSEQLQLRRRRSGGRNMKKRVVKRSPVARRHRKGGNCQQRKTALLRIAMSDLFNVPRLTDILPVMFNTQYQACEHRNVKRTYEQFRSNDENATLVRLCMNCGKRL